MTKVQDLKNAIIVAVQREVEHFFRDTGDAPHAVSVYFLHHCSITERGPETDTVIANKVEVFF